jgi:hypothetical protein
MLAAFLIMYIYACKWSYRPEHVALLSTNNRYLWRYIQITTDLLQVQQNELHHNM